MNQQLNLYYKVGQPGVIRWLVNAPLLCLVFLPLAAGCTKVGPDFETPVVPEEQTWIEESNPKIDKGPVDNASWWRVFNDPVINELVVKAYSENLTLQTAGLRVLEARARLGIAIGGQYPQVQEANGSLAGDRLSTNAPNNNGANRSFGSASVGLDASWEIDFWGKFQRGIESADAQLGATVAGYDDALVTLTADVVNSYILMRAAEEQIHFAEQNVKVQTKGLALAQAKYENGATSKLDVAQARALLNNTKARIPGFETDRRQAQNALAVLLGTTPRQLPAFLKKPGKIPSPPKEVAIGIPADLIRRRPDIRQAELLAMAQTALVGVATADLYPSFVLSGTVGLSAATATDTTRSGNTGFSALFSGDSLQYAAGPSFSWNLFNYGRLKNNIRVQDARLQQLLVNYQNTVLRAAQEVEDSMIAYVKSLDERYFLVEAVGAAERSEVLSMLRYKEGFSGYQRVLDAQQRLVVQQQRQAANLGAIALNLISIYKALGGGWQVRENQPFIDAETQKIMQERSDWGRLLEPAATDPPENPNAVRPPDW